jgi:multidrug efflux pump subunit AcrA (membrane-fusion protein)
MIEPMRTLYPLALRFRAPSSSPGHRAAPVITGLALAVLMACGGTPQTPPPASPPTVTVARPTVRAITDWDEYTGRLGAVESVEVRARVSGYLQAVHFAEGTIVQKGTPLVDIDPRPYEAVLAEAKAEVTRARVRLELSENDLDRAQRLFGSRAISEEELDARTQEKREAVAALEAAEAAVASAQLMSTSPASRRRSAAASAGRWSPRAT